MPQLVHLPRSTRETDTIVWILLDYRVESGMPEYTLSIRIQGKIRTR
jgi:hypothetical protein